MHGRMLDVSNCLAKNWVEYTDPRDGKIKFSCKKQCGCDEIPHTKMLERFVIVPISSFGGMLMRLVGSGNHDTLPA